jgi:hypothetical protein
MLFYCLMLCPCCCSYKAVENIVEMMSNCCSNVPVMLLCGFAPRTVVVVCEEVRACKSFCVGFGLS